MGILADIYSGGNTLKRRLNALIADPAGTINTGVIRAREDNNKLLNLFANAYPMAGYKTVLNSPQQIAQFQREAADEAANMGMAGMTAGKFEYPQAKALETAQRNASKPISQGGLGLPANNTPIDRAKAMGFDTEAYHGTGLQANVDDPSGALLSPDFRDYIESADGLPVRSALFTSTSPKVGSGYAERQSGQVAPLLLNEGKQAWSNANGKLWIDHFKEKGIPEANARGARTAGYDSYKIKNVIDPFDMKFAEVADTIAMVNPKNIRSRFAAFDPARRNEADILGKVDNQLLQILAGAGLLGVGGYNAIKEK